MSQLEVFEKAVREKPYQVRIFGPPNWLVCERAGPHLDKPHEMAEKMAAAVEELRAEYGLDKPVPKRPEKGPHPPEHIEGECGYCVPKDVPTGDVSPTNVPSPREGNYTQLCQGCYKRPVETGRQRCSGCRKAAQRAKS